MITITILGLDHYVTGEISKQAIPALSQMLRIPETDILFFGPEGGLYFQGVDQTSWQGVIIVTLPETLKNKERDIAAYLLTSTSDSLLNLSVEFHYFATGSYYERVNEDYPRFLREDDLQQLEADEENDDAGVDEEEHQSGEEVYHGNAFADFEERARAAGHNLDED
ncbi:MAG: hypothetical protein ACOX3K_04205 [Bacilli bacterium]|jgi:hypothetical protein